MRSLCEHHLLPFIGVAHVGYLPDDRILGLSKFARTVEFFARRAQTQERLTTQIADHLQRAPRAARRRRGDRGRAHLHEPARRPRRRAPAPSPRRCAGALRDDPSSPRRVPLPDPRRGSPMSDRIVVVGGGLAAGTAVTELREHGYDGDDRRCSPTRRTRRTSARRCPSGTCSARRTGRDARPSTTRSWYADHDVDLRTGTHVETHRPGRTPGPRRRRVDPPTTGCCSPPAPGPGTLAMADDSGAPVGYLRTLDDSVGLRAPLRPRAPGSASSAAAGSGSRSPRPPARRRRGHRPRVARPAAAAGARARRSRRCSPTSTASTASTCAPASRSPPSAASATGARRGSATAARSTSTTWWSASASSPTPSSPRPPASPSTTASAPTRACAPPHEDVYAAGDVANADHPVLGHLAPRRALGHRDPARQGRRRQPDRAAQADADALPYFFTDQYDLGMEYVGNPGPGRLRPGGAARRRRRAGSSPPGGCAAPAWWPACTPTTGTRSTTYAVSSGAPSTPTGSPTSARRSPTCAPG